MSPATILLVEDDDDVREFVAHALRVDGYAVLLAADGAAALRIARDYPSPIDLLLCDIVMPELSGSEVAMRLLPLRPDIKILHVSGYPGDALSRYGDLLPRVAFLEKPFTAESLGKKVRAVLSSDLRHA